MQVSCCHWLLFWPSSDLDPLNSCLRCLDIQMCHSSDVKPLWQKNDSICPSESHRRPGPQFWLFIGNKSYNKDAATQKSVFLLRLRSERSSHRFRRFGNNNNNNHNNKKTFECINMGFLRGLVDASWMNQDTHRYTLRYFFFSLHLHL